jgi:hypothetical protein
MTVRILTVLAAGLLLTSLASFADEKSTDADKLITQLGSSKFAEREAALKALEAMGPAALPALRRGAAAKDPEVRQQVADLIAKYERQADSESAFAPTKVRLKFAETPLADVVADLAKQAKVRIQLAKEPADLPARRVTIDTGEVGFWQALDRLCESANVSLRPTAFEPAPAEDAGGAAGAVRFMAVTMPRVEETLVIQHGALAPCPTAYLGAARVRLIPDRWGNRNLGAGEEHKWMLEVLSEPRLTWQSPPTVQFDPQSSLKVSANVKDEAGNGIVQLPGGGGIVVAAPAIRVGGAGLTPNLPRTVSRHEIPVSVKSDAPSGTAVAELAGTLSGTVRLAAQRLASIADVTKADNLSTPTPDGGKMTVRDCKVADDGVVTLKVEVERAGGGGGGLAFGAVARQIQVGGGGALPPNVARAINPMFGDGDSFKLFDQQDGEYTLSISETSSSNNGGVTVMSYTLECRPPGKDAKPKKLELHGPRRTPVESKFTLRNLTTP